jgi:flagellar motor component MotA
MQAMALKDKLDETRAASAKRRPQEARAIMQRATDNLRASGILATVVGNGQTMPAFVGTSHDGREIASANLVPRGPLVLSFFRGHW